MEAQLWFTSILNKLLGGPVASLLSALKIPVPGPDRGFSDALAMEIFVALLLVAFFGLVRMRLSVERPSAAQHIMESIHEFVEDQSHEIIGHHSEGFTPFLVILGVFILISNLIGLVPGFESPTQSPVVPLGCALLTWCYYHFHGIRKVGPIKYLAHFLGPQDPSIPLGIRIGVAILLFPIEIFSHLARVMSLTIRLFANMYAGEMVTLAFFSLIPIGIPLVFMGLHLGVAVIQTYIFVLLATVYLAGAVAEEH